MMKIEIPFTEKEVACNCGCGYAVINEDLLHKLIAARFIAGVPFDVISWCRCEKHNEVEGGKEDSAHLEGLAVDIYVLNSMRRYITTDAFYKAGFKRIGIGKSFVHADVDSSKPSQVMWTYS